MTMTGQDVAVAAVALAGAALLGRRLLRSMRPSADGAPCPSCASGTAACAKPVAVPPVKVVLVLVQIETAEPLELPASTGLTVTVAVPVN